jgi:hypothetical protein
VRGALLSHIHLNSGVLQRGRPAGKDAIQGGADFVFGELLGLASLFSFLSEPAASPLPGSFEFQNLDALLT